TRSAYSVWTAFPCVDGRSLDQRRTLRDVADVRDRRYARTRRDRGHALLAFSEHRLARLLCGPLYDECGYRGTMTFESLLAQCVMCYRTAAAQQIERSR